MKKLLRIICRPTLLWVALFLTLSVMQWLIGRNTDEAIKFLCAAAAAAALEIWFSRKKPRKETIGAFVFFSIPALIVIVWAGINMPQEASAGDYSEIMNGLQLSKDKAVHQEIKGITEQYFQDDRLSRWEAAELRHLVFEKNGWLYRGNAAKNQAEAREELRKVLNAPYDKKNAKFN
ncbi:TPA: hypothetical protein JLF94_002933 [Escherichia coli]|nr:hypothetical protein [Escherichia coli]